MLKLIISIFIYFCPVIAISDEVVLVSPFSVQNQISKFGGGNTFNQCRNLPSLPHKVESVSYYTDKKSSVVDLTLHARFLELRKVISDAQNYLATQNIHLITSTSSSRSSIAECSVKHLLQFAKDDAFTGSDDIRGGGAIRLMSVTPLMTYLLLRDAGSIEPEQDILIRSWITRLVDRLLWLENKYKYDNNIEDWTGAAFALSAVALNRPQLLEHAIQIARKKSQMVNADGFLPAELDRGQMAVVYNLSALQALSIIISVAQANGIDLLSPPSHDGLFRMMQRMLRIIEDPESFLPFATTPEAISSVHFDRQNMGWLLTYFLKSKDLRALKIICDKKPLYSWRTGGDWFVLFGNPNACS